jgi:hypothetical protein
LETPIAWTLCVFFPLLTYLCLSVGPNQAIITTHLITKEEVAHDTGLYPKGILDKVYPDQIFSTRAVVKKDIEGTVQTTDYEVKIRYDTHYIPQKRYLDKLKETEDPDRIPAALGFAELAVSDVLGRDPSDRYRGKKNKLTEEVNKSRILKRLPRTKGYKVEVVVKDIDLEEGQKQAQAAVREAQMAKTAADALGGSGTNHDTNMRNLLALRGKSDMIDIRGNGDNQVIGKILSVGKALNKRTAKKGGRP